MSSKIGKLMSCDRCGDTLFLKRTSMITTVSGNEIEKYEPAAEWGCLKEFGDLCPKCLSEYEIMMNRFLNKNGLHDPTNCKYYDNDRCLGTREMDPCEGDRCKQWKEA